MNINKDEIGELWDEITPKLYGYLFNTLKDKSLADDILQNTWVKAIEALPRFENRGYGFKAWLFSIARNEMRMHWRKVGREVSYDESLHDIHIYGGDSQKEDKIFLGQIVSRLKEEDQELIRLRYIADLSFLEIAKLLNINPITARVKINRALGHARVILKTQQYERI
ncbi:MAG: sigma-70 family RNA polymerase sigma factor [bacterium]